MPENEKKKNSFTKEAFEWGILLAIIATLYFTGLHTEVIGKLQSVLLYTGLMQPDTELTESGVANASYNMPLVSLHGEQTSLEKFKGKTIFLNFWATWCAPCIAEMPNIQKLYEDVSSDSISFVIISLDEDQEAAKDFISRKEYTLPVYFMEGNRPGVYNSTVVPTTYVISPDGKILIEHRGMANYNTDKFKSFLQETFSSNIRLPNK